MRGSKAKSLWKVRPALLWSGLCLLLAVPSVAPGATYTVAPGGSDSNPGTPGSPWRTLARASSGLQPGDTVYVRAGVYHEHFQPDNSGAPSAQIVYKAYPGERPQIDGTSDGRLNVVTVWASYVTIEGFLITNQNYYRTLGDASYWVALEGNYLQFRYNHVIAYGDVWENIYVKNAISRGIVVAGHHTVVEHCYVRGQVFGIVLAGPSPRYTIVRYDTVHATGQNNIDNTATIDGETAYHGTLIEYCQLDTSFIEDNIQFEVNYKDPTGTVYNRGVIVRHNVMGNAAENAIDLKGAGHTIIENNLIYSSSGNDDGPIGGNDSGSGGGVTSNPNNPTRFTIIRGNVIWDHSTGMEMAEGDLCYNNTILNTRRTWRGGNQTEDWHAAIRAWNYPLVARALVNNMICDMPTGAIYSFLMDWGDKFTIDNNLYFESTGPIPILHRMSGQMYTTHGLAEWKSLLRTFGGYAYMSGKDQNSIEADPQFINVPRYPTGYDPSWDFGLVPTSPAIDAGRPVAQAQSTGVNSRTLTVDNAYYFCDGFDITDGDVIKIGSTAPVRILDIDYSTNVITLAEPRNWTAGEGVHLDYEGKNPDIGAFEYTGGTPQLPAVPALSTPADGLTNAGVNVVLNWSRADNAASYELEVATTGGFDAPIVARSGITALTFTVRNLAEDTKHFWRVRAANGVGISGWSTVFSFTTLKLDSLPPPPTPEAPGDGATGISTNPHFSWSAIGNAQSYHFQIARNPNFTSPIQDITGLTDTGVDVSGLSTNTLYYWRVSARSTKGQGPWSLIATLTTFALPPTFGSEALSNGMFTNGTSDWSFFTDGIATFTVTGPGFRKKSSGKVFVTQSGTNTQLYQGNLLLSPDSTYRLSFAAYSSTGNDMEVAMQKGTSPFTSYGLQETVPLTTGWNVFVYEFKPRNFSGVVNDARLRFSFSTFGAAGDIFSLDNIRFLAVNAGSLPPPELLPVDYALEANFPNPFNPVTTIRYSIPTDTRVRLDLYNILGQHVKTLVNEFQRLGTYNVRVDMAGRASGVYFYTLQADAFRQTRKFLLVK